MVCGCSSPRLKRIVHDNEIGYYQKNQEVMRDWDALGDTSNALRILLQTHNNFGSSRLTGHAISAAFSSVYGDLPNTVYVDSFALEADSFYANYYYNGSTPLYNTKVPLRIGDEFIDSLSIPPALMVDYSSFLMGEDSVIRWNSLDPDQFVLIRIFGHKTNKSRKAIKNISVSLEVNDVGEWKIPTKALNLFPEGSYIDITMHRLHNQHIQTKNNGVILFSSLSSSGTICERR